MSNGKFKVGDKVKISPDSKYYGISPRNPKDEAGEVIEVRSTLYLPIRVQWVEGTNSYQPSDLEHSNPYAREIKAWADGAVIVYLQPHTKEWKSFNDNNVNWAAVKSGNHGQCYIQGEEPEVEAEPLELWVNVYSEGGHHCHDSKDDAVELCGHGGKTVMFREVIEVNSTTQE